MKALLLLGTLVTAIISTTGVAWAKSADNRYQVEGAGNNSCGQWMEVSKGGWDSTTAAEIDVSWVQGYVTSYNDWRGDVVNHSEDGLTSTISLWLTTYCPAHPLDDISQSAEALVVSLRERKR